MQHVQRITGWTTLCEMVPARVRTIFSAPRRSAVAGVLVAIGAHGLLLRTREPAAASGSP